MDEFVSRFADSFDCQQKFFQSGATLDYADRLKLLRSLRTGIEKHEQRIFEALKSDLGKPAAESFSSEIGYVYAELTFAVKNLRKWMQVQNVNSPMFLFPSKSKIVPSPKGTALIIGPWNYPFQLQIAPLIGALAAGCTAFLKPSEFAPATAAAIEKMVSDTFDPKQVAVVLGDGKDVIPAMMESRRFDHIFFTGSSRTGALIAQAAAKDLIPTTLELGGKSPAIVDSTANLKIAARRITWGKFFNAGQTCVAPDYVLIEQSLKEAFVDEIKKNLRKFFGEDARKSDSYARIINTRHFEKLEADLVGAEILLGGEQDASLKYFAPTVVDVPNMNHRLMQNEIFGPILPVVTYTVRSEIFQVVRQNPMPLAFYLFTTDKEFEIDILQRLPFGGGCINDVITHLANPHLPFGGTGTSGTGKYHGKYSFEEFTNRKSILVNSSWFDLPFRYPPYNKSTLVALRKLLK